MQTDRMLYLALKNFRASASMAHIEPTIAADAALAQFELEMGPLPDWASAHNIAQEPVLYAQLYTKNGRRCGNAMISLVTLPPSEDCEVYYHVITDMGNEMRLSLSELNELFDIGDYIGKEYGIELRQRQNWSRAIGELGPDA